MGGPADKWAFKPLQTTMALPVPLTRVNLYCMNLYTITTHNTRYPMCLVSMVAVNVTQQFTQRE